MASRKRNFIDFGQEWRAQKLSIYPFNLPTTSLRRRLYLHKEYKNLYTRLALNIGETITNMLNYEPSFDNLFNRTHWCNPLKHGVKLGVLFSWDCYLGLAIMKSVLSREYVTVLGKNHLSTYRHLHEQLDRVLNLYGLHCPDWSLWYIRVEKRREKICSTSNMLIGEGRMTDTMQVI